MNTLALQVQEDFGHEPHAGNLYIFRGRRGEVVKTLWHIGLGISLYAIGRDSCLALPHRQYPAAKLSPKSTAVFGGCSRCGLAPAA